MAELHVQRKKNNNAWIWILLLIIVIAAAAYYYFNYYQKGKPIPGTDNTTDSTAFKRVDNSIYKNTYDFCTAPHYPNAA